MARIVIVDDDELLAELVAEALTAAGHMVSVVHHGDDVIAAVGDSQPDLLILDYDLPGKSGLQILREVREQAVNESMPVMMCSGHSRRILIGRAIKDGADDYVTKPVDIAELVSRSEALLLGSHVARCAASPPQQVGDVETVEHASK